MRIFNLRSMLAQPLRLNKACFYYSLILSTFNVPEMNEKVCESLYIEFPAVYFEIVSQCSFSFTIKDVEIVTKLSFKIRIYLNLPDKSHQQFLPSGLLHVSLLLRHRHDLLDKFLNIRINYFKCFFISTLK